MGGSYESAGVLAIAPKQGLALRHKVVSVLVSVRFAIRFAAMRERASGLRSKTSMNTGIFRCRSFRCGMVQTSLNPILSLARLPIPPLSHGSIISDGAAVRKKDQRKPVRLFPEDQQAVCRDAPRW